jgi:hypothetical protein
MEFADKIPKPKPVRQSDYQNDLDSPAKRQPQEEKGPDLTVSPPGYIPRDIVADAGFESFKTPAQIARDQAAAEGRRQKKPTQASTASAQSAVKSGPTLPFSDLGYIPRDIVADAGFESYKTPAQIAREQAVAERRRNSSASAASTTQSQPIAATPQSQPQLVAQVPTQPKGHWETDYVVHPGSKDGTVKLIYAQPDFGDSQEDVKNKVWPAHEQDSDTFKKGALPSSQAMGFSGQIVRRDAKGKTITIPFKARVPVKLQPGDQIQEFVREQPGTQKTNAQGQATPVDTFKEKLSNNALKRLQDNSNRLKSELKDYQNLSPNNPKWQQLRQLAIKDQQLVQQTRRLDGQIAELVIKDRKENSFTSPNTFIDRDDVHPLGVVSPRIQAQIKQIESQQALLKIARRQMQAQYPALAVVDSAKVASSSNQALLGNINQGFGQIQGNIGDLQTQIQADPSKALFLDDVVKGTLSGLKVDPNNPNQTKTGQEITNWLQGEQTKRNLIKWGGTLLTGGLTVGAIITTFASEGLALPFWLGLGGAVTGLGTAAYDYRELATVDLAAQAQQGGGGNLTSQDKDTARFNLIMGQVNLLMAGLDVGLSVKAVTGLLKTRGAIKALSRAESSMSQSAFKAMKAVPEKDLQKVLDIIKTSPEQAGDILETYYIKCIQNREKYLVKYGGEPPSVANFLAESLDNLNTVTKRGYPFGFGNKAQFEQFGGKVRTFLQKNGYPDGDLRIQGSAVIKQTPGDIDIGIMVSPEKFDDIVSKSFGKPNPGSSKEKTMSHASAMGKVTAGDTRPKLSSLRKQLEEIVGKEVDISIIRTGGEFDAGATLRF